MPQVYNTTESAGLSPTAKQYYDKRLIESGKPKLVYAQFGQKRPVPLNGGKTISFRRFLDYTVDGLAQLAEDTVPDGVETSMAEVVATLHAYGRYTMLSTPVVLEGIDPVIGETVGNMGINGMTEMDLLIQKVVHGGTNVMYAGGKGGRGELTAADKLTTADIRKAVKLLKKNKAQPFTRGGKDYYVCPVAPDAVFDLQEDAAWQDVSKYQDKEQIYSGEIGRLFGVIFVEHTNGMLYAGEGASGADVMSTVVVGKNAYGYSEITGKGGVRSIVKPRGSAGTSDPLDQFTTVGWKLEAFATARLRDDWIVRIEHGFTE